jgi:uncharacterized protein DUF5681
MQKNDSERIGYGKPPRAHRFKPGVSGNPSGRPKKTNTVLADLFKELNSTANISETGHQQRSTKQRAILRRLVDLGVSGDLRAVKMIVDLASQEILKSGNVTDEVGPDDSDVLRNFIKREGTERIQER